MAARIEAAPAGLELVLTRVFNAPRRLLFCMWTEPEHAVRWWGPKGFTNLACEMDLRPGGGWHRRLMAPDGALRQCRGTFCEIVEPERLVFTYRWDHDDGPETLVTVTFADLGDRTELTLRQTGFATAAQRDSHDGGWNGCLERFAEHLHSMPKED